MIDIETLAKKAADGDESAFHEIVDILSAPLYRTAYSLCGNAHDAEDLLQETFLAAFRGLPDFRFESLFKTWITGIMVRQAGKIRRRRGKYEGGDDVARDAPEVRTADGGVALDIKQALQRLPSDLRETVVLREVQGLSYTEMADALEVPVGTVESRLYRARQRLQKLLSVYKQVEK